MNILFLTRLFYPHIGGVEKHVEQLSKQLIAQGHHITIITESPADTPAKPQETYHNIQIYRIPYYKDSKLKKLKLWQWLWHHRRLIFQANIIHCHDVFFWYLPFRLIFPHKPVYTTFHGYESYPIPPGAQTMHKIAELLSRGNICVGQFISKWYTTKATIVTYGAVDIPPDSKDKKVTPHSAVFIGRLDEQTGILDYAESIKIIRHSLPDFQFTIVGDGALKEKVQKTIQTTKTMQNKFEDFQKNPEKYFYTNHFAFVSRYLSILEAMAAKRLIFALYDNPLKEDYLKMTPYAQNIIIAATPDKIAEKVEYFLKHPEKEKKLIEKNYTWVRQQTWQHMAELYLNLWQNKQK
jgi:glycosyltransferase involved in cell wall biosynthesis